MLEAMAANRYTVRSPLRFRFLSAFSDSPEATEAAADTSDEAKRTGFPTLCLSASPSASASAGRCIGSLLAATQTGDADLLSPVLENSTFASSTLLLLPKGLYTRTPGALRRRAATLKHLLRTATPRRAATQSAIAPNASSRAPKVANTQNQVVLNPNLITNTTPILEKESDRSPWTGTRSSWHRSETRPGSDFI
jgi:hypothetical protein